LKVSKLLRLIEKVQFFLFEMLPPDKLESALAIIKMGQCCLFDSVFPSITTRKAHESFDMGPDHADLRDKVFQHQFLLILGKGLYFSGFNSSPLLKHVGCVDLVKEEYRGTIWVDQAPRSISFPNEKGVKFGGTKEEQSAI